VSNLASITDADGWFIGEDKTLQFTIADSTGATINITGWQVTFKMSSSLSGDMLFTKTVGSGITLTSPTSGILQVLSSSADTLSLAPGTYFYALRRTDTGFKAELDYGSVVLKDVYVNYTP
jgi:hypothetical protein